MRLRGLLFLTGAALAGCSDFDPQEAPFAKGDTIDCAFGTDELSRQCGVERVESGDEVELVIHHPDGGFRRFTVMRDGSGLAATDGADVAQVSALDGAIEVSVDGNRYILPATITDDGGA